MEQPYEEYRTVFKALSDEIRLKIVDMLSEREMCGNEILEQFTITQPTLSYHMRILTSSGIVSGQKRGSWIYYSLQPQRLELLRAYCDAYREAEPDVEEESAELDTYLL